MRAMLLLVCCAAGLYAQNTATLEEPHRKGAVVGQIVDASTQEGLPKAVVSLLEATPRPSRPRTVRSGAEGRFEIQDVEPGRYHLQVRRNAFVETSYGQRGPRHPGTVLDIGPGQILDELVIQLQPAGVITGRVLDEDGEALARMQVSAMQFGYVEGERQLVDRGAARTDDRGIYRISGLGPGRYYLCAGNDPDNSWMVSEQDEASGYPTTFYPGSPDSDQASLVEVGAGSETVGIDLKLFPSKTLTIEGQVISAVSNSAAALANLLLTDRNRAGWAGRVRQDFVQNPDGRFQLVGLSPGAYRLTAMTATREGRLTGSLEIDLLKESARDVQILLYPGVRLLGRVVFDGEPPAAPEAIHISLQPIGQNMFGYAGSQLGRDHSLEFESVPAGSVRPRLHDPTGAYYLKSLRYGSREVLDGDLNVSATEEPREIILTLSDKGPRLAGVVTNRDSAPTAGAQIVLVPENRTQTLMFKTATSDQTGVYSFTALTPGRYKAFAWESIDSGAWLDPNVLEEYETKGESIELEEGDAEQLDLKLIENRN